MALAGALAGCGSGGTLPGPAPILVFGPSSINFGNVSAGTTSGSQAVTLINAGMADLNFTSIAITGTNAAQFAFTTNCGNSLAAGASCSVNVSFSPNAIAVFNASLIFTDNNKDSPQNVALSGTGIFVSVPAVTLSPSSLIFNATNVGSSSAGQLITLTNSGTGPLTINSIGLTGANTSSFRETNTCGASLATGSSCTISVTFSPTAAGTLSASVSLSDNAGGSPQTVTLSGTGVGVVTATLTPGTLTFASSNIGSSSAAQSATLTNTGSGTLNISSIGIAGTNATSFTNTTTCGATLNPSASCTISVTFTPTAAGALSATLSVADNASGSPQTVTLSGTGAGVPTVTLLPGMLMFGSVTVGTTTSAQTATLTNTGTGTLNISSIAITGTNPTSFAQTNTCAATLAPGASCMFSITFKSTAMGALSATLTVADNAIGSPQTVALSGTGSGTPTVLLTPGPLAFGEVVKLTPSAAQTLTLQNTGNTTLNLSSITFTGANAASFTDTTTCGATIAANASCTITVTATPAAIGPLAASISFADDAPNTPQTLALTASGVKPQFKGLLTMNNTKKIAGEPDNNMEELNAHPNVYVGAVIHASWAQLEPSPGVFDKTAIEAALANIDAYNTKYPAGPKVYGKLRILVVTQVPAWLLADTGSVVTTSGTIADFWTAEYTRQWRILIAQVAAWYDLDERLQEVAISSCASNTGEPFVLIHGKTNTPALLAAGYTDAQYHACLNGAGDDYSPFKYTPIDFTFNGEGSLQTGKAYASDQNASVVIMDAFRAQYPVRSVVANHGLANPKPNGQSTIYANFTTLYNNAQAVPTPPVRNYGLEFQTINQTVNWDNAIAEAESYHATEVEVWDTTAVAEPGGGHGKAPLTETQLQGYAAGIAKD